MIYLNKKFIVGIAIITCVALCASVWPQSAEVEYLPAEPVKTTVTAAIEARSEERPQVPLSADALAPEAEAVAEVSQRK